MRDIVRFKIIRGFLRSSREEIALRLLEVQSAIKQNLPNAERWHFEQEIILELLKEKDDFSLQCFLKTGAALAVDQEDGV